MDDLDWKGIRRRRRARRAMALRSAENRNVRQRAARAIGDTLAEHPTIRSATMKDLRFIDLLQRSYSNHVGFLPVPALAHYITRRCVFISTENNCDVAYLLGREKLQWQPLIRPIYQIVVDRQSHGRRHAVSLITFVEHLADRTAQLALQANCADDIPAHEFWPHVGFRFIAALPTVNARHRTIICWRKALVSHVPTWFIHPPARAGYRGKKPQHEATL